ncbi:MAG: hypothetical protein AAGN35_13145 [Bacteroidota bacterium]
MKAKSKRRHANHLDVRKLREFPGFGELTDKQAQRMFEQIKRLCCILYSVISKDEEVKHERQ